VIPVSAVDQYETTFERQCRILTKEEGFTSASASYTLCIYPTEEFYDEFATKTPMAVCMGAIFIIIFTSGLFFAYDFRVFHNSDELLEAKRLFMRFISHEVRFLGIVLLNSDVCYM